MMAVRARTAESILSNWIGALLQKNVRNWGLNLIGLSYKLRPLNSLMGSQSLLKTLASIFASLTSLTDTNRRALREAMVGEGASGLGMEQRLSQLKL